MVQLQNHQQSWLLHLHKTSARVVPVLVYIGCMLQGWWLQYSQWSWLIHWCMRLQNYQSCWVIHWCSMKVHCSVAGWCIGIGGNYKSTSIPGCCMGDQSTKTPAPLAPALVAKVQKYQQGWLVHQCICQCTASILGWCIDSQCTKYQQGWFLQSCIYHPLMFFTIHTSFSPIFSFWSITSSYSISSLPPGLI